MHMPDGSTSVLTQGRRRIQIVELIPDRLTLRARGRPVDEQRRRGPRKRLALMRAVLTLFEKCVQLNRSLPEEAYVYAVNIEDPGWLADLVASALQPERRRAPGPCWRPSTRSGACSASASCSDASWMSSSSRIRSTPRSRTKSTAPSARCTCASR